MLEAFQKAFDLKDISALVAKYSFCGESGADHYILGTAGSFGTKTWSNGVQMLEEGLANKLDAEAKTVVEQQKEQFYKCFFFAQAWWSYDEKLSRTRLFPLSPR